MKEFDLIAALRTYQPWDNIEALSVAKTLDFLIYGDENNKYVRTNLAGHITGSAFLFNRDYSKVLLTHHKKLNRWLQFGGHSDGDTNTLHVAQRETTEESGIANFTPLTNEIFDVDAHTIPANATKNEPAHTHYDIRFAFVTDQADFVVSDESDTLQWFTLDEFKALKADDVRLTTARQRFIQKWEKLLDTKKCKHTQPK